MYGLLAIVEAVRQLRGECGERQVEGCEVALAHGNGGVLSSQATLVLGQRGDGLAVVYAREHGLRTDRRAAA